MLLCPNCRMRLTLAQAAPTVQHSDVALGQHAEKQYCCAGCGAELRIWKRPKLYFQTLLAIFSIWFAVLMGFIGLFAVSVLLGWPAAFGFASRTVGDNAALFAIAAIVGLSGSLFALFAYVPDVIRQWMLRRRLPLSQDKTD